MEQWTLGGKTHARFFKHLPLSMVLALIRRVFDRLSPRTDHGIGNGLSFGTGKEHLYQPFLLKSFQKERQQKEKERQQKEKEQQQKEKERQQKENALAREKSALAREKKALAEVERLRALLQDKDSDPR